MTRVLVTGAGGFLGGAIARRLAERGDLEAIASARGSAAGGLDLGDADAVATAVRAIRPDIVVHAAGRTHGSSDQLHTDNVVATRNLAEALTAGAAGCGLILLGSAAQYGRSPDRAPWREAGPCEPLDDYGRSKLAAEAAAFATAPKVTSLRIFNVIAPRPTGHQVFSTFLRRSAAALAGPSPWRVEMGPLGGIRDFVCVDDVLTAVERAIEREAWGGPINVCSGVGRTTRSLLQATATAMDRALTIEEATSGAGGLDWSVGDPAGCQARLGFTPSSDLTALTQAAAAWVMAEAREGADAGSGA